MDTSLLVTAGPRTDWFVDPQQSAGPRLDAPALVGDPSGEFLLSARVTVDFAATYDAGVLMLHASDSTGRSSLRVFTAARADGRLGRDEGFVRRLQLLRDRR